MINLRAYDENELVRLSISNQTPIYLRLQSYTGGVLVVAVGADGRPLNNSNLIRFSKEGTIIGASSVNDKLGFQLTDKGCIKFDYYKP